MSAHKAAALPSEHIRGPMRAALTLSEAVRTSSASGRVAAGVLAATAVDLTGFWRTGPAWRYALLLLLALAAVYLGPAVMPRPSRVARPPFAVVASICLAGLMVTYSWAAGRDITTTAVLWVPLMLLLTPYLRQRCSSLQPSADVRLLVAGSTVYIVSAIVARVVGWSDELVNHENAFVSLGIAAFAVVVKRWILACLAALVVLSSFLSYPAATYLVAAATLLAWIILTRFPIRYGVVMGGTIVTLVAWQSGAILQTIGSYLAVSGKGDNSETRLILIRQGIQKIQEAPVVGNLMAEGITARANIRGEFTLVPIHNGPISIAIAGGILFLLLIVWAWVYLGFSSARLERSSEVEVRAIGRLSGATLAMGLVSSLFNPVTENLQAALLLYSLAALAMLPRPSDSDM